MRITLSITNPDAEDQDLLTLEVFPEMTVEALRSSIHGETHIDPAAQHLYHNGRLISDNNKTMEELSIGDGEMLALHVRDMRGSTGVPTNNSSSSGQAGSSTQNQQQPGAPRSAVQTDPEVIRLQFLGNPSLIPELRRTQPRLADHINDPQQFAAEFRNAADREFRDKAERQRQIAALNADPFDVEAQAKIEEMIRQERVMENLQNAMEHNPEVFGRVHMLYVDVEVNGHKLKALVDSGAQTTIMSPACAEACNIMRLVDKRFAGIAKGVGTAMIMGRVHSAQIKIGSLFLPCSFTVMEGKNVELLLGLDMLKRHQACLDLGRDKLLIQGVEVPFLGEADIPKEVEEALAVEPKLAGPSGMAIGAKSGTVSQVGTSPGPGAPGASGPSSSSTSGFTPSPVPGPSRTPRRQHPDLSATLPTSPAPGPPAPPPLAAALLGPPSRAREQPAQPAQQAQQTEQAQPSFPNEAIEQLVQLGFSREAVINALHATGGNVEYAAGLLFDQ